jgi:GNAT superfamily N-acetyltransferase
MSRQVPPVTVLALPLLEDVCVDRVAGAIAHALHDDPILSYWIKSSRRFDTLLRMYSERLRRRESTGQVLLIGDFAAIAIATEVGFRSLDWIRVFCRLLEVVGIGRVRLLPLLLCSFSLRKENLLQRALYLEAIATSEEYRNRGYAGRLLSALEDESERLNLPLVCETHDGILRSMLQSRRWVRIERMVSPFEDHRFDIMIFWPTSGSRDSIGPPH